MKTIKFLGLTFLLAVFLAASPVQNDKNDSIVEDTIVDLAVQTDALSTLVAAVQAAGLVDVLSSEGPFTVFAPTNEAFAALPEGTLESLLLEENRETLIAILTYHVVPGTVMSGDLSDGLQAETVQGSNVTIGVGYNSVTVNGANVVQADVVASNGVVHVIDAVILPPTE